jgi:hypothetical protein
MADRFDWKNALPLIVVLALLLWLAVLLVGDDLVAHLG